MKDKIATKQTCEHTLIFGDDFGDNPCTMRCQLPKLHKGEHEEKGMLSGVEYILKWKGCPDKEG